MGIEEGDARVLGLDRRADPLKGDEDALPVVDDARRIAGDEHQPRASGECLPQTHPRMDAECLGARRHLSDLLCAPGSGAIATGVRNSSERSPRGDGQTETGEQDTDDRRGHEHMFASRVVDGKRCIDGCVHYASRGRTARRPRDGDRSCEPGWSAPREGEQGHHLECDGGRIEGRDLAGSVIRRGDLDDVVPAEANPRQCPEEPSASRGDRPAASGRPRRRREGRVEHVDVERHVDRTLPYPRADALPILRRRQRQRVPPRRSPRSPSPEAGRDQQLHTAVPSSQPAMSARA